MRINGSFCLQLLLLALAGCQAVPQSPGPIVGDSVSLPPMMGYADEGGCYGVPEEACAAYGMEDFGPCWNPGDAAACVEWAPAGCAGYECDGRCGGRCPRAQYLRQLAQKAHRFLHSRPLVTVAERCCANGCCGAVPGPETGAVTYPYYTVRGPRDFLLANPPGIGP